MTKNPYDSAGRDPLEEFLKKLQEQGFDPSAMNGAAGFDADALKNMDIPLDPAML